MGGAGDFSQRSSSPLKRRAEEFDMADPEDTQSDDVDMLNVSDATPEEPEDTIRLRGGSVDMLRNEGNSPDNYNADVRPSTENVPSIDEQIAKVQEMVTKNNSAPLSEGDKIYLVSRKWLERVLSRGSGAKSSKDTDEDIGPVDNSDIILEILKDAEGADFARLIPGLGSESFEFFPEEAWELVVSWYGVAEGSPAIIRFAHNTNQDINGLEQCQYEFYPPVFKLHRVWSMNSPLPLPQKMKASQPEAPVLVSSRSERLRAFLIRAKNELQIDIATKVRMWRILVPADSATQQPATQEDAQSEVPGVWSKLLVDSPSFTKLDRDTQREELKEADDVSANPKYNGNRTLAMAGLLADEILVFEEQIKDTPSSAGTWLTSYVPHDSSNASTPAPPLLSPTKAPAPSQALVGPVTRGRANRNGKTLGVVGLSNLGNTCYMNSALQCVRSVEELTKYFLTDESMVELNAENPLGNNGEVATAYHRLLHEIYRKDSNQGSVRPSQFKNIIGKYAPQFSGFGQQDSQEFLGFLLDGLQEDLSRVKKKPYIEKPDSTDEMVNNPELIREMASKVWDITKKRDDSVIADLFTGMYKSTLVCPVCSKVSITFDPFNNLTLQLPIAESFTHTVTFFPLNDAPVDLTVDIDKNASIKVLKQFVGQRVDIPIERMIVIDQWNWRVYKIYDDSETASEVISSSDKTHIYELDAVPTNWPTPAKVPKKKKAKSFGFGNNDDKDPIPNWDDPMADRLLVPVIHRRPNTKGYHHNTKTASPCLVPFFITLTPTEASDMNIIKRKILEKVATLTTYIGLHEEDEDENESSDIVITTGSDADSSGDGKVTATSVDGEDDVVDVTMKEVADEHDGKSAKPEEPSYPLRKFRARRPKFLDPSTFLSGELQNMFEMGYFAENNDIIPTGWHSVNDNKTLPKLSERDPQLQAEIRLEEERQHYRRIHGRSRSEESSSRESDDDQPDFASVTGMADESSDEDAEPAASLPVRPVPRRPNPIKGNKFTDRLSRRVSEEFDDEPTGPILRLGEGICVDWTTDAFEALFGDNDPSDTQSGTCVLDKVEQVQDPVLQIKIQARALRKRNGVTLEECLDEFQREEILSEMDTWYCPRCKEHQRASKKFELWKTPDILIIHLKRFSSLSTHRSKLDALVEFPVENLDISSRVIETEPGKKEVYDLFAVDNHMGGLGGGHYTAYAKSFFDNQWYNYNDTSSSKVSDPNHVVSSNAYLLFYRRRSEVPLGGPRFQQIVAKYDNPLDELEQSSTNESGEDQRLVANSSQHGSSSALTGVEAVHHRDGSQAGIPITMEDREMTQGPPAYPEELENNDNLPLLVENAYEDEGLGGMDDQPSNTVFRPWAFNDVPADQQHQNTSVIDGDGSNRSDTVANGSELDTEDLQSRLHDFDSAEVDDAYIGEEEVPPPDIDMDADADRAFQLDVLSNKFHVVQEATVDDDDEADEKVDEIHV